jgi:regulator of protease activity HflC (stomatin/prohibitin superfamily)
MAEVKRTRKKKVEVEVVKETYQEPPMNNYDQQEMTLAAKLRGGALIFVALIGLLTAWMGVYTVDEGYRAIIKRNGAIVSVQTPGMHFKMPWLDTADEIEIRERAAHLELAVSSRDPMLLPISATVNWLANENKLTELYREYGSLEQFEKRVIIPAFNDGIKTATALFTVNDLLRDRTKLGEEALKSVRSKVPSSVMTITQLFIVDVGFPKNYTDQILAKQVASEAALTEEYKLKQQQLVSRQATQTAEANRDAAKATAEGEAFKIKAEGEAKAEAITAMGKALTSNPAVIEYEKVKGWSGKFPETFMGGESAMGTLWNMPAKTPKQ